MGVYRCLWVLIGVYEFLGFYGCLWVSGSMGIYGYHGCLCVLYLNIKNIAYIFSFKNPRRFENLRKRLKSHMCYKK